MKLIADGDMLLYRAASASEKIVPVDNFLYLMSYPEDAIGIFSQLLKDLEEAGDTEDIILAFSDRQNWRRNVMKDYKANRKAIRKPIVYGELLAYATAKYETMLMPGLEADDIMGIFSNRPGYAIWTLDKDLKQCPGVHLVNDAYVTITEEEGDRFHLFQAIKGDITDGYAGCPGMGDMGADEFLNDPYRLVQTERELKSGKHKGEVETRWEKEPTDDIWAGIVSLYEKAGLTEADALVQARVARILRDGEYNFKTKQVRLWKPTSIRSKVANPQD